MDNKSIGGISPNLVVAILIIVTATYPVVGLILSVATLILEVNNNFVRYYAKHLVILGLIMMILSLIKYVKYVNILFILLLIYMLYESYNKRVWKVPFLTDFINKIGF